MRAVIAVFTIVVFGDTGVANAAEVKGAEQKASDRLTTIRALAGYVETAPSSPPSPSPPPPSELESALRPLELGRHGRLFVVTPSRADQAGVLWTVTNRAAEVTPMSLFKAQRSMRDLKDQLARDPMGETSAATKELTAQTDDEIEQMAEEAGIDEPFYAELVSGLITSANESAPGDDETATLGAHVRWRSRYFLINKGLPEDDKHTFRLSGRFGRVPVTALIAPAQSEAEATAPPVEAAAGSEAEVEATDVPAFVWDARIESVFHGERTDWVAYAGGGQTWLVNDTVTRTTDEGRGELALSGGRASWMGEAGFSFNVYQKGRLDRLAGLDASPRFSVSLAYRRDALLSSAKDFGRTNDRLVFRMLLAELHVFDRRNDSKKPGPFSIRFGVEHERGVRSNGAPAATRLLIAGDMDILQALGGGK
jgi:hypothetical protein